jgi:hypothetical protein
MNRARRFVLIGLAVVVVLFAVTWATRPGVDAIAGATGKPPASLFLPGLGHTVKVCPDRAFTVRPVGSAGLTSDGRSCSLDGGLVEPVSRLLLDSSDIDAVKTRIRVVYGSLAVVIVLVGLAFGAGRSKATRASGSVT